MRFWIESAVKPVEVTDSFIAEYSLSILSASTSISIENAVLPTTPPNSNTCSWKASNFAISSSVSILPNCSAKSASIVLFRSPLSSLIAISKSSVLSASCGKSSISFTISLFSNSPFWNFSKASSSDEILST